MNKKINDVLKNILNMERNRIYHGLRKKNNKIKVRSQPKETNQKETCSISTNNW